MIHKFRGTLIGGAIGDAIGGPIEFMQDHTVRRQFPNGLRRYLSKGQNWPQGTVTDDTQMTLFSCEGILDTNAVDQESLREACWLAYRRWYYTQTVSGSRAKSHKGLGLLAYPEMYVTRAPGNTCMGSLGGQKTIYSSGCGGVMRSAPFGLQLQKSPRQCFRDAAFAAALTHGKPEGYLPAGALAAIIRCLLDEMTLTRACYQALRILRDWKGSEETQRHIKIALGLAESIKSGTTFRQMQKWVSVLGAGWTGEEALGIGLYATLAGIRSGGTFLDVIALAVSHGGDSDSTGSIAGNIAGAWFGLELLPRDLVMGVEHRDILDGMATRLYAKSEQTSGYDAFTE